MVSICTVLGRSGGRIGKILLWQVGSGIIDLQVVRNLRPPSPPYSWERGRRLRTIPVKRPGMDERTHTFLLLLGFSAYGGFLGAAFGASAGYVYWASGRASGTAVALAVARALARVAGSTPPRARQGAIVGAVDGFLFLGLTALIVGFLLHRFAEVGDHVFAMIGLGGLVLSVAALVLGVLAYCMARAGVRGLAISLPLAILSACAGLIVAGWAGYMVGIPGGLMLGTLILFICRDSAQPRTVVRETDPNDLGGES